MQEGLSCFMDDVLSECLVVDCVFFLFANILITNAIMLWLFLINLVF